MNFHTPATYKLSGRFGFWRTDAGLQPARHIMTPGFLPVGRQRVGIFSILGTSGRRNGTGISEGGGQRMGSMVPRPCTKRWSIMNILDLDSPDRLKSVRVDMVRNSTSTLIDKLRSTIKNFERHPAIGMDEEMLARLRLGLQRLSSRDEGCGSLMTPTPRRNRFYDHIP